MELKRRLGLVQATALNMIDMVGIGPFVTFPIVISAMGSGPAFIWAWVLGAVLSFIDAHVWSELGARFPEAGGSYRFLNHAYGGKTGRFLSFLYTWQTVIQAPLVLASGAIGFSLYFGYLVELSEIEAKLVSGSVVMLIVFLLYRRIDHIGKLGVFLWIAVLGVLGFIVVIGLSSSTTGVGPMQLAKSALETDFSASLFWTGLGAASVKTVYSYLGYYNVCHLGAEITEPTKNIPKSMFLSIGGIAILYLLMNFAVINVIPIEEAGKSEFIVSTFTEKLFGPTTASILTVLVLVVAFASLLAVLLGYSRVPYAAAKDGNFLSIFGKLHPTKEFPYVSLLIIGGVGFLFSLLYKLADVISAILAMRILIQFIGQAIGLLLLSKREGRASMPWKMKLYPIPVILAIGIWIFVFQSVKPEIMGYAFIAMGSGAIVYFLKEKFSMPRS